MAGCLRLAKSDAYCLPTVPHEGLIGDGLSVAQRLYKSLLLPLDLLPYILVLSQHSLLGNRPSASLFLPPTIPSK